MSQHINMLGYVSERGNIEPTNQPNFVDERRNRQTTKIDRERRRSRLQDLL